MKSRRKTRPTRTESQSRLGTVGLLFRPGFVIRAFGRIGPLRARTGIAVIIAACVAKKALKTERAFDFADDSLKQKTHLLGTEAFLVKDDPARMGNQRETSGPGEKGILANLPARRDN